MTTTLLTWLREGWRKPPQALSAIDPGTYWTAYFKALQLRSLVGLWLATGFNVLVMVWNIFHLTWAFVTCR